jgi:hypothetical protein
MRTVQIKASTQQARASAPCVALAGNDGALCASFRPFRIHLPALPSLGAAYALRTFRGSYRCGTMRALTPAAPRTTRQASPFHPLAFWTCNPQPRRAPERHVPITSCVRSVPFGPGFAKHEEARRYVPPNRVRYPTGCSFASGCSPPRLTATQLPSATCVVISHDTDFHLADQTNSRTHIGVGKVLPSPPSEPYGRFSRIRLSSRWFLVESVSQPDQTV